MKIGDYVRTKAGVIRKICLIEDCIDGTHNYIIDKIYNNRFNQEILCIDDTCIIKSSPNIIDLIKEGDLVNNHIVTQVFYENQTIDNIKYLDLEGVNILVCNDDIKSIVTREMFESMEYKVGE